MDGAEPLDPLGGSAPGYPPEPAPSRARDDIDAWEPPAAPDDDLEAIAPLDLGDDEDDDGLLLRPDPARAAFWLGAGELERGAYFHASRSFRAAAEASARPPGDPARVELARGLFHLAVGGFKGLSGDPQGKARQLAHARRRLAPFLPEHEELDLDLAALLAAVEADGRTAADTAPGAE